MIRRGARRRIRCPECNEQIDARAVNCHRCGFQLQEPRTRVLGFVPLCKLIFLGFSVFMFIKLVI